MSLLLWLLLFLSHCCFFSSSFPAVFIQVNGRKLPIPSEVLCDLSVNVTGGALVIEWASVVKVTYTVSKEVTVYISSGLSGKVCGACGNFNNNLQDDMKTADGEVTTDVANIVSSWRAGDFSRW